MQFLLIKNITKSYKVSERKIDVLKDINLALPSNGIVTILGKSGSGKSTLLNIIGKIDNPTIGKVKMFDEKGKEIKNKEYKNNISFIFQHYYLLESESALFNVMLPGLIQNLDKSFVERQAKDLLKLFNLKEEIYNKKTKLLSGGEKERIAILRALITNPRLILADEPTGALDKDNAIKTMKILKKASKKRLVILVTHNKQLAEEYSDRIIRLSDGKIVDDKVINKNEEEFYRKDTQISGKNNWTSILINRNFKKRFKRNFISIIGMTISLIFCYLMIGFSNQSNAAIKIASERHLDYGTSFIRNVVTTENDSSISLVKTLRPSEEDISEIKKDFPEFVMMPNYDAVFGCGDLVLGNKRTKEISISYIYDFDSNCYDRELLISPIKKVENWPDVIANKKAYELIGDNELHYKVTYEHKFKNKEYSQTDLFEVDQVLNVVGVCEEFDFLCTPKIYFNYKLIDELLNETILENLSSKNNKVITWANLVRDAMPGEPLSSYSIRCFLTDISKKDKVDELYETLNASFKLENDSISIKEAMSAFTLAASYGLDVFLIISLFGSLLIVGIFSYSAYVDDKKESSILSCLGARDSDIVGIFVSESIIVTFLSFVFATGISGLLEKPTNMLLFNILDISNLIDIPYKIFMGKRGFLPISIFVFSLFVTIVFSAIPILINKKISIKKELMDL